MKAAIFHEPNKMSYESIQPPVIQDDEVLLRVAISSVCGTDVRIFEGRKTKGVRTNSILGHEIVGTIEQTGSNVSDFKKGDRVGVIPVIPCNKCTYCLNGRENACINRTAIGYEYDGGFAEFIRIPSRALKSGNLVKLPSSISFRQAVVAEPLACCINGSRKTGVKMNDLVVVIGAGPIGLMHVQLAKIAGAKRIIVSEIVESRRMKATEVGADIVVDPTLESLYDRVMTESDGEGADCAILAIGVPSLINETLRVLRKGGVINLFAGFNQNTSCAIDPNLIHYNELRVVGTSASTRADYLNAIKLIESGRVNTDLLTTPGYTLADLNQAILDVKCGKAMKPLIEMAMD
ncbi:zinc-dependent dehydrogenase [Alicyclobacillus tolerans]|uniref:zinc-dependent dehydrogenase n=1 Tax=Alicyclobacillus tolerans TaxID=90970 RepID=UPI001F391778|nr:zinc-dependent dehydrogenase [Alicyclobacillus tolerans]MCF8568121.1 zinc-dependent dehydrogenase [Alicyclobacillus tolerans]